MTDMHDPAFQQSVFTQAYEQTCSQLANDAASAADVIAAINTARNHAIEALVADASKRGAACSAGCSACCHQMVLCTPAELFSLARYILDMKSAEEMSRIKARLATLAGLPLNEASRYGADKPCALLEDHRCSAYEHRPALCRTMLSSSRVACDTSLATRETNVPFIAEPVVVAFLMQLGIDYALISAAGVSTEKVELSRALSIALADFDAAFRAWLGGKDPFADCHPDLGQGPSNRQMAERAAAQSGIA